MTSAAVSYRLRSEDTAAPLQGEDPQVTLWTNSSWSFHADKAQAQRSYIVKMDHFPKRARKVSRAFTIGRAATAGKLQNIPSRNLFKITKILKSYREKAKIRGTWQY